MERDPRDAGFAATPAQLAAGTESLVLEDAKSAQERQALRMLTWTELSLVGPPRELTTRGELQCRHLVARKLLRRLIAHGRHRRVELASGARGYPTARMHSPATPREMTQRPPAPARHPPLSSRRVALDLMAETDSSTRWTIHGERLVDQSRRLRLSIVEVELPDGVRFEQYVLRFPRAAMMVVLDDPGERVLMMWRHRFIIDRWVWELPGGYVDPDEDPAVTAAREVEEETGWRPREVRPLVGFQPMLGSADAENLLFVSRGAEDTGQLPDINETQKVEWIALAAVPDLIERGEVAGAASLVGLLHVLAVRPT